jgi:hypothetical protein
MMVKNLNDERRSVITSAAPISEPERASIRYPVFS